MLPPTACSRPLAWPHGQSGYSVMMSWIHVQDSRWAKLLLHGREAYGEPDGTLNGTGPCKLAKAHRRFSETPGCPRSHSLHLFCTLGSLPRPVCLMGESSGGSAAHGTAHAALPVPASAAGRSFTSASPGSGLACLLRQPAGLPPLLDHRHIPDRGRGMPREPLVSSLPAPSPPEPVSSASWVPASSWACSMPLSGTGSPARAPSRGECSLQMAPVELQALRPSPTTTVQARLGAELSHPP